MDTIFITLGSNKTTDPHRLILSTSDKVNLKKNFKCIA